MKINIVPLKKIEIDGKSVELGMTKEQVVEILGAGELSARHYFYDYELAIDYDENNTVEFIEFLGGIEGTLHPVIYGKSAFQEDADEIFELLKKIMGTSMTVKMDIPIVSLKLVLEYIEHRLLKVLRRT